MSQLLLLKKMKKGVGDLILTRGGLLIEKGKSLGKKSPRPKLTLR